MRSQGTRGPSTWGAAEQALDQDDNIKVVARIRPLNERELAAGDSVAVSLLEPTLSQMQVCAGGLSTPFAAALQQGFKGWEAGSSV
jgi:hypothetical protein